MANALKLITCSLIGTLLAIAIAGVVIEDWVDHKINEVSVMVDYKNQQRPHHPRPSRHKRLGIPETGRL